MKNFLKFFIAIVFCSTNLFGQVDTISLSQTRTSGAVMVKFAETKEQVVDLAKSDIENHTMYLLVLSGISPVAYSTDLQFENEFKVKYLESGCTGPKEEFADEYNFTIFNYLTTQYGSKWKKNIRKDVAGFSNYNSGKNK